MRNFRTELDFQKKTFNESRLKQIESNRVNIKNMQMENEIQKMNIDNMCDR